MRINIAQKQILDKILERKRHDEVKPEGVDLKAMLKEILAWANRFVPSESGSILLDDPILNQNRQKAGLLYFVACFGKGSSSLIETSLPLKLGIAGQAYSTGRPYISKKVRDDDNFYAGIDKKTNFHTKSIICAPIKIKTATIGVIELINRVNGTDYDQNDLTLLRIFAEYTSTLIQNSLDAKKFGELSMKDNLTGLYNDRYFYVRLTREVTKALRRGTDLSLLFLDLDRFKEVNDTLGHLAGSRVLMEVGVILKESLKRDWAAVRYGGDEFVVIMPGAAIKEAFEYGERLRRAIQDFIFLRHRIAGVEKPPRIKGLITSSIGVASLRNNFACVQNVSHAREALIKLADAAMYKSKQDGKNMVTLCRDLVSPDNSFQDGNLSKN